MILKSLEVLFPFQSAKSDGVPVNMKFLYIICLILQSQLDVGPLTFSFIKKKPFFVKNICNVSYSFIQLQNFNTESSNNTVIANQDEAKAEDLKASQKWPSRRSIWIIS